MTLRWSDQAWPELGTWDGDKAVGLIPVGAVEQHGPHLPAGTDTIISTRVCELASDRCGAPVLPSIAIGCSYGHGTNLPGTFSLTPELMSATAQQMVEWAALSGLKRIVFVNAHFGNVAALSCATDHLRLFRPDLRCAVVSWYDLTPELLTEVTSDGADIHANRAETSVMLHLAPELVHLDRMADADDPDRTDGLVFRYTATALSTNGVTGSPSLATAELGARLVSMAVDALVDLIERARCEEPPLGSTGSIPLLTSTRH